MTHVRDYASDTRPLSSYTRGELEALVMWLRGDKARITGDNLTLLSKLDTELPRIKQQLKEALEANVVLCEQVKAQDERNKDTDSVLHSQQDLVEMLERKIMELEDGECRFNCRTGKARFAQGAEWAVGFLPDDWEDGWKDNKDE